jgi:serine/threonine-protein kinase
MNPDDDPAAEESFEAALVAYDEALARGEAAEQALSSAPPGLRWRLEQAREVLRRLEEARREPRPAPAPARLDRFRILRELGRGGFGVVYLAHDPTTARDVALKVPRAEALLTPELCRRFLREAHTAAGLDHPHLVPVYEARADGPVSYIASAYCPGGSLADWLRRQGRPMPWRLAAQVVAAVADAVAYVHGRGILHRDLKPANVLLAPNPKSEARNPKQFRNLEEENPKPAAPGVSGLGDSGLGIVSDFELRISDFIPKVTDFGLAKAMEGPGETRSVAFLGTPAYMAPEQAAGRSRDVTPATDVYALGAILYECLTGRPPFTGESDLVILQQVQQEPPVPPRQLRADVPRDLEAVCLKCLEKDPARRFASAAALADELRRCLRGEPTLTRPPRWPARAWRAVRRRPLASAAALVFTGLAVGLLVVQQLTDPDRPLRALERRLAAGQAVTLVGETGPPAWFRVRAGEGQTNTSIAVSEPFAVSTYELSLVDLLPDPQRERYRFRAEVRHDRGNGPSQVGIYFGHRQFATARGVEHCLCELAFSEANAPSTMARDDQGNMYSQVLLQLRRYRARGALPEHLGTSGCGPRKRFPFPAGGLSPAVWHRLAVEVRPEGARAYWDNEMIGEVARDYLWGATREMLTGGPEPIALPADPPPDGALGLFVLGGMATFRSVAVEPLNDEK